MITEYELYVDERYQRNGGRHLFLGGLICTDRRREILLRQLATIRADYRLAGEMKWAKISKRYLEGYKALIELFFTDPFVRFSMLVAHQSGQAWRNQPAVGPGKGTSDEKLASAFYQFLLRTFGPLRDTKRWWVYPDEGMFARPGMLDRVEFLFNRTYKRAFGPKTSRIIRLARSLDSKQALLVQLADVLLGALACSVSKVTPRSEPRRSLLQHLEQLKDKHKTTARGLARCMVHDWVPPAEFKGTSRSPMGRG